jgi:hypothetical protein
MVDVFSGPNEYQTQRDANNYESKNRLVKDPFWTENLTILAQYNRLVEFIPTKDMTRKEQLNAISRFFIYASIILTLYTSDTWPIYLTIFGMGFTLFLFKFAPEFRGKNAKEIVDPDVEVKGNRPLFTTDVDRDRGFLNRQGCTAPSKNNPFMNVTINEIADNPTRPPACEYDTVKHEIDENFYHNLYQDVGNAVFGKNNSQRQYFTMPYTTIPNDQSSFARWLYDVPLTCKEDSQNCLRSEDLRQGSRIVGTNEYIL